MYLDTKVYIINTSKHQMSRDNLVTIHRFVGSSLTVTAKDDGKE